MFLKPLVQISVIKVMQEIPFEFRKSCISLSTRGPLENIITKQVSSNLIDSFLLFGDFPGKMMFIHHAICQLTGKQAALIVEFLLSSLHFAHQG